VIGRQHEHRGLGVAMHDVQEREQDPDRGSAIARLQDQV
jgi:hypothetical protein